jgi:toxin CcdB
MAQFDVHTNLGRNRSHIPYLVNVQSRRHDGAGTRVVVPLMRLPALRDAEPSLTPKFTIQNEHLVFNPLLLVTAPAASLGPVIPSLATDKDAGRIIAAIDAVITQAFG